MILAVLAHDEDEVQLEAKVGDEGDAEGRVQRAVELLSALGDLAAHTSLIFGNQLVHEYFLLILQRTKRQVNAEEEDEDL